MKKITNHIAVKVSIIVVLIMIAFFTGYKFREASLSKQIDVLANGAYLSVFPESLESQIEIDIEDNKFQLYELGKKVDVGSLKNFDNNTFKLTGEKEYHIFYKDGIYTFYYSGINYEGRVDLKYYNKTLRK